MSMVAGGCHWTHELKMAKAVLLLNRLSDIADEHIQLMRDAEVNRDKEYRSAVCIQSWYRGIRIRSYLKFLNECAVRIQRHWRGFRTRAQVRQRLVEKLYEMKYRHYTAMTIKIQKIWKGYWSRKYIFSFAHRKKYFEELCQKSDMVRKELADYKTQQDDEEKRKQGALHEKKLEEYALRHHYLVSTVVLPGVYNSPFQLAPNEIEFRLRNAKFNETDKDTGKRTGSAPVVSHAFDPTWSQYNVPRRSPLPPVKAKPMGPFREPREVQLQRYKPFQPTLRVMTDYFSIEKAQKQVKVDELARQITDVRFLPCSRLPEKKYEPFVTTSDEYSQIPYGTQLFRRELPSAWLSKDFRTVVPPIPIFDRFNDTYAQGTV